MKTSLIIVWICMSRYTFSLSVNAGVTIEDLLACYKRPITLLDLKRGEDIFHGAVALLNQSTVVVFSENQTKINNLLCAENRDNIIIFKQVLSDDYLRVLEECEHFDIVMINLAETEINDALGDYLWRVLRLGDFLVCQAPCEIDAHILPCMKDALYAKVFTHGVYEYIIKKLTKSTLLRRHIFWPCGPRDKRHEIFSTFIEKKLIKTNCATQKTIVVDWLRGINLLTFIGLNHYYPSNEMVMRAVKQLKNVLHQDWGPSNMIISGAAINLIDLQDFHYQAAVCENTELFPTDKILIENKIETRAKLIENMLTLDAFIAKFSFYWAILNPRHVDFE